MSDTIRPPARRLAALPLLALAAAALAAQATPATQTAPATQATPATQAAPSASGPIASGAAGGGVAPIAVPRGFRGIELGMAMAEVEDLLSKDALYRFRGPEDVSLLPSPNQSLVEATGVSFVKRALFQFHEGRLWAIILMLNEERMDHFTMYETLRGRYGEPVLLNPGETRWEDAATRLALERPLTLRYLDVATFRALREGAKARESAAELDRADFLGDL